MGIEAWRQLHIEFMPRPVERGTSLPTKSLSLAPAKGFADLRDKIHELEGEVRSYEFMTRKIYGPDMLNARGTGGSLEEGSPR